MEFQIIEKIASVVILIFSAVLHEVMHGAVAEKFGDNTARLEGRITLNPISHLDLFGSVLLPLLFVFSGVPVYLAWAKPVPVNPYNMRDQKMGMIATSLAGPLINLIVAIVCAFALRFLPLNQILEFVALQAMIINLSLFAFNILPIPPLDGSKVFFQIFLPRLADKVMQYEAYGMFVLLFMVITNMFDSWYGIVFSIFLSIFK